jgi:insulysin
LNERTYDADLAGMSYIVSSKKAGLMIVASGYNDKLWILLHSILKEMKAFVIKPERFDVVQEQVFFVLPVMFASEVLTVIRQPQLRQEWRNTMLDQPYYLSELKAIQILQERSWDYQERLNELESTNFTDGFELHSTC